MTRGAFLVLVLASSSVHAQELGRARCAAVNLSIHGALSALTGVVATRFGRAAPEEHRRRPRRIGSVLLAIGLSSIATSVGLFLRSSRLDEHARWVGDRCRARYMLGRGAAWFASGTAALIALSAGDISQDEDAYTRRMNRGMGLGFLIFAGFLWGLTAAAIGSARLGKLGPAP